ncbi:elongation factor 2, partial [Striga asiatica]
MEKKTILLLFFTFNPNCSFVDIHVLNLGTDYLDCFLENIIYVPMDLNIMSPLDLSSVRCKVNGLHLLNLTDPFVEVSISCRGKHVVAAAGEVHLEKCVTDLKERFAKVRLKVSPPLVSEYVEKTTLLFVPQNIVTARKLIDAVRRRKGLPVEEKMVYHATKQRTLAR